MFDFEALFWPHGAPLQPLTDLDAVLGVLLLEQVHLLPPQGERRGDDVAEAAAAAEGRVGAVVVGGGLGGSGGGGVALALRRAVVPHAELAPSVGRPEAVAHQVVDDEPDLDERVAVRLGHAVHDVAHQVLQSVGGTVLLQGQRVQ